MRVVVIGGCGGLGQCVVQRLIEVGHKVTVVDSLMEFVDESKLEFKFLANDSRDITVNHLKEFDLAIHLAEDLMLDHMFSDQCISSNATATVLFLKACLKAKVPCWIGSWELRNLPLPNSIIATSLYAKRSIIGIFSKRITGIVRELKIPKLIDLTAPSSNYLSILPRIHRMCKYQSFDIFEEDEIVETAPIGTWNSPDNVAKEIVSQVTEKGIRQRKSWNLSGHCESLQNVIGLLLHEMLVDSISLQPKKSKPIQFDAKVPKFDTEIQITRIIRDEIRREEREDRS